MRRAKGEVTTFKQRRSNRSKKYRQRVSGIEKYLAGNKQACSLQGRRGCGKRAHGIDRRLWSWRVPIVGPIMTPSGSHAWRAVIVVSYLWSLAGIISGADYVGAEACRECHRENFEKQSTSHHAHALHRIAGTSLGTTLLAAGHSPDGLLEYQGGGDSIAVLENGLPERALLEWAFGAGAQGSTAVGHFGDQYFEHRFSYYARVIPGSVQKDLSPQQKNSHTDTKPLLALTFGHPPHANTPLAELGLLQDNHTITGCFNCHATGVQQGSHGPDLSRMRPGISCERCHGPGSNHIEAARRGTERTLLASGIFNPGRLSSKAQIGMCGQCHRLATPGTGDEPELESPVTVRFAPISLTASRCYRASGKIACLTCHNPHADAEPRTDFSYSEKCLTCHANTRKPIKFCRRVERENCLPCHMRQASLSPYLRFTDHRIRVY